jgi:DNA mismatch endonuclease (patch repair protein)
MVDVVDRATRSRYMAAVRSRGNRSTEAKTVALLRLHRLAGWRRHYPVAGTPDFCWPEKTLAVFIDGCFWHGCPRCYNTPKSNIRYWKRKVESNRARDRKVNAALRRRGWLVIRVWECELKKAPSKFLGRIMRALQRRRTGATARHPLA